MSENRTISFERIVAAVDLMEAPMAVLPPSLGFPSIPRRTRQGIVLTQTSRMLEGLETLARLELEELNERRVRQGLPPLANITMFNTHLPNATFDLIMVGLQNAARAAEFSGTTRTTRRTRTTRTPAETFVPIVGTRVRIVGPLDPDEYGYEAAEELLEDTGTVRRIYEDSDLPYIVQLDNAGGGYTFAIENLMPE